MKDFPIREIFGVISFNFIGQKIVEKLADILAGS